MNAKEEQTKSVYKELITVEVAAEKIAGTDDRGTFLDNIKSRLEDKEEFEGSNMFKRGGDTLVIQTKEGYEFAIVGDKVILANGGNGNGSGSGGTGGSSGSGNGPEAVIPQVKEGEIQFKTIPNYWVNTSVNVEISSKKYPTLVREYTNDYRSENWNKYNGVVKVDNNQKLYARLSSSEQDDAVHSVFSTHNIGNIDKTPPTITNQSFKIRDGGLNTKMFAVELEAQDTDSGIAQITWNYRLKGEIKWTKSVTDVYHMMHTKDSGSKDLENKTHEFNRMQSGVYEVQANVYDVAGNVQPTEVIEVNIGKIDDAINSGEHDRTNLTYEPIGWTNRTVSVNLPTISGFETRYTLDGSAPNISSQKFEVGKPIILSKNTRIYYIFTDGVNVTKYATKEVTNIDTAKVAVRTALKESSVKTDGFKASIQIEDEPTSLVDRSGLAEIHWFYKISTSSGPYTEKTQIYQTKYGDLHGERGKTTKDIEIKGLTKGTYELYADIHDVAGNVTTTTTITVELGSVAQVVESSASFDPTTWTAGDVRVTLSKADGFTTMYTDDGTDPKIGNPNLKTYTDPFTVTQNGKIKYMYTDGTNISNVGVKTITNIDKTPANISDFAQSEVTTNSFKLTANIQDSESGIGKIIFWYKHQNDSGYTSKVWSNPNRLVLHEAPAIASGYTGVITAQESFTGMKSGAYECYIQVFNTAGTETTTISSPITFSLGNLPTVGDASFNPTTWTNGDVTVTLPTASGFTTRYTTNGNTPNLSSTAYNANSKPKMTANGTVKYIYTDGTNISGAGSKPVTNIDKKVPTITTALSKTGVTSKGFTLTISVQDTDTTPANASGLGKIIWYYKLSTASSYSKVENVYTALNGSTNGSRNVEPKEKVFDGLTTGTYNAYAEVYDVAGNKVTSSVIEIPLSSLPTVSSDSISFSPSGWTNGNVTVTLPTSTGYETRYTTDGTEPTKTSALYNPNSKPVMTANGTIKFVYTDGTNVSGAGSKGITNIDKAKPTATVTGSTATANTGTVTASNITDPNTSGVSGVKGYYFSTNSTAPTKDSSWTAHTSSTLTKSVTANGTYYIWFIDNANNISDRYTATVSGIVSKVTVTAFSYSDSTINPGQVTAVPTKTITGSPKSGPTYSSSNTGVATVASDGKVTGVAAGTTVITIKYTNYDGTTAKKTYSVTIAQKVTVTTFSYSSATIDKGKTSGTPTKTIIGTAKSGPTYSSSNTSIATVNSSTGVVIGVSAGSATITISYINYDGSTSTKTCNVTIKSSGYSDSYTALMYCSGGTYYAWGYGSMYDSGNTWTGQTQCIKLTKSISKVDLVQYASYESSYVNATNSTTGGILTYTYYLRNT